MDKECCLTMKKVFEQIKRRQCLLLPIVGAAKQYKAVTKFLACQKLRVSNFIY